MTSYTDVFSAGQIQSSYTSYKAYTSTSSLTLVWPVESAPNNNVVAVINDINFTASGLTITMPPANEVSVGVNPVWNNIGSFPWTLLTATGGTILTATTGAVWESYLADNTSTGGTWRVFQAGAGTSSAQPGALAGYGLIAIGPTLNQQYQVVSLATNTVLFASDRASTLKWTSGAGAITATSASSLGNGWFFNLTNQGTGAITFSASGNTIDGETSKTFNPGDAATINSDGTNFVSFGFGQDAVFAFDYTSIDVAGSGNYTLSGSELNRIAYKFTGVLTGVREIIVPSTVQQYLVDNSTTGSFALGVRTVTQSSPGVEVVQGGRMILYSNGTDVVNADTQGVTVPLPIAQGGTGATSAAGARTSLDVPSNAEAIIYAITFG